MTNLDSQSDSSTLHFTAEGIISATAPSFHRRQGPPASDATSSSSAPQAVTQAEAGHRTQENSQIASSQVGTEGVKGSASAPPRHQPGSRAPTPPRSVRDESRDRQAGWDDRRPYNERDDRRPYSDRDDRRSYYDREDSRRPYDDRDDRRPYCNRDYRYDPRGGRRPYPPRRGYPDSRRYPGDDRYYYDRDHRRPPLPEPQRQSSSPSPSPSPRPSLPRSPSPSSSTSNTTYPRSRSHTPASSTNHNHNHSKSGFRSYIHTKSNKGYNYNTLANQNYYSHTEGTSYVWTATGRPRGAAASSWQGPDPSNPIHHLKFACKPTFDGNAATPTSYYSTISSYNALRSANSHWRSQKLPSPPTESIVLPKVEECTADVRDHDSYWRGVNERLFGHLEEFRVLGEEGKAMFRKVLNRVPPSPRMF
ncbi:hypothetical protein CC1G_11714 [Coprinopsis cinerea okayama7|uniref:Uncharacterized protein n=1 Tax=Coprinopsis cinerea (strain Okayama-7 / 130 / ATCC MYA-4618 / FGSC 9003) TaxID=240176 RepID=A8NJV9_COPC7|nr:hypothetical protein CC1G_11714 [Coprinopsis cinerea okayama7\|eukprot:XP_001834305.2 hypothetical protein CC1G_11714 [Coprinopsis cinerea okayama7\